MLHSPAHFYSQLVDSINTYGISFIVLSIFTGGIIGYLCHYYFNIRPLKRALEKEEELKDNEESEKNEKSRIRTDEDLKNLLISGQGQINTSLIKKSRVAFNPNVDKREEAPEMSKENRDSSESESEHNDPDDDDDEEQMPQFNNRKVTKTTPKHVDNKDDPLDSDRISETLGKLHGKLATAQLKAKTRQMVAEMSAEERDYEAQMKARQMESIMKLMMNNKEKFGMSTEDDIKEQMNLYNF